MSNKNIIKSYSIEDLEKHFPAIDFLNHEAMMERMGEKELNNFDYVIIKKVLENFITDGEAFELYEDYQKDEVKGRVFEILYKMKDVKDFL